MEDMEEHSVVSRRCKFRGNPVSGHDTAMHVGIAADADTIIEASCMQSCMQSLRLERTNKEGAEIFMLWQHIKQIIHTIPYIFHLLLFSSS